MQNRILSSLGVLGLVSAVAIVIGACNAAGEKTDSPAKKVAALAKEGYLGEPEQWAKHSEMLGKPMPKLEVSDFVNKAVTADDMKGKIVVIDFWATWCGPCLASIPHNNEFVKKYADKGVVLVGACGGGGEEKLEAVAKAKGIEYSTGKVTKASTEAFNIAFWPTYVVVDRQGNIRAYGIQSGYVDKVVDALLEEQPPEKAK